MAKRCFAFSGDSGWCEGVIQAGKDADLYLMECTMFSTKTDVHIDYKTLQTKWDDISAKRCMLTHMSEEMLTAKNKIDTSRYILASDGFVIEV